MAELNNTAGEFDKRQAALAQGGGRVASVAESADWLIGHLESGLQSQHYAFPRSNGPQERFHLITKDMDLPALTGDMALTIIVPAGVTVRYTDLGDNRLLFAEDFSKSDKWNRALPIAPPVLEELSKRDYWAEAFIFAEPDDDANAKLGRTAAAKSEAKNFKERKAVSKADPKAPAATAEDFIRAAGIDDPKVEAAMIAQVKAQETGPSAADFICAAGIYDPAVEAAMIASVTPKAGGDVAPSTEGFRHIPAGVEPTIQNDPWVQAQFRALEAADAAKPQLPPPPVESASKTGFVKGLLNKAFNLGAPRTGASQAAVVAAPATSGPKQKAPAV